MKNFKLIKNGLNLEAIRNELTAAPADLWFNTKGNAHTSTRSVQLRSHKPTPGKTYHNIQETIDMPAWNILTETRQFVLDFLHEAGGELGHVRLTNLNGEAEIPPHIDEGEYWAPRNRYHLVITSEHGTLFTAGDETITMKENEFWWFDNKKMHQVKNLSQKTRTHLIFDILPPHAQRTN